MTNDETIVDIAKEMKTRRMALVANKVTVKQMNPKGPEWFLEGYLKGRCGEHSQSASAPAPDNCILNGIFWDPKAIMENELHSLESIIEKNLSGHDLEEFNRIYYGRRDNLPLKLKESSYAAAEEGDFDVAGYAFPAALEHTRPPRIVRLAVVQHSLGTSTDKPVHEQRQAIYEKVKRIIDVAGEEGVNILCLQELWSLPYVFCTREKQPWCEFAESAEDGPSIKFLSELAAKYNMVIISPILERDESHGDVLWNTAVVISDTGAILGKHRKNHIPRVGDFNESTYYMEGNTGHPVFETRYGRIAVLICFGRHHSLNWMMFGNNGAEIVFNPNATTAAEGGSEWMWNIEARNAAIHNTYFTAAINRVGYETFPNEFTSGDGKPAHKDFGLCYGSSYFCGPDGVRCPGLSRVRDGLLIAEVDLNKNRQIADRRCYRMTQRLDYYVQSLSKVIELDYKRQIVSEFEKQ